MAAAYYHNKENSQQIKNFPTFQLCHTHDYFIKSIFELK